MKLIKLDAIDSTNSYLKELVYTDRIKNYTVVISRFQSMGRGRNNNIWQDMPSKNLNFSMFKKFKNFKISDKFLLNIITSLSVCQLLKNYNVKKLKVKWPNDIMTGNKKISGILIENNVRGFSLNHSILGIGININQISFINLPNATSVKIETGFHNSIDNIANELQEILKSNFKSLNNKSEILIEKYNNSLYKRGKLSKYSKMNDKLFKGKIIGINNSGDILIQNSKGDIVGFQEDEIKIEY